MIRSRFTLPLGFLRTLFWACLVFPALLLPQGAAGAEAAKLPYLKVAGMLQEVNNVFRKAKVDFDMELRITSKRKGVKPSDIKVVIDTGKAKTPIELGPGGLLTLPLKKDYFSESCFLTTNQPKGSLDLGMLFTFGKADIKPSSTVKYAELLKFMTDLEKVAPDLGKMLGKRIDLSEIRSVPYRCFTRAGGKKAGADPKAKLILHTKAGDKVLHADEGGIIEIPWTKALIAENPKIRIPDVNVAVANDALWSRLISANTLDR